MNKIDVLQQLFKSRDTLTALIIHVSPAPDDTDGAAALEQLIQQREQVTHAIAQLIAAEVVASGDKMQEVVNQMTDLNKQLQGLAHTIASAKLGISIAAQVLSAVAQVAGALL